MICGVLQRPKVASVGANMWLTCDTFVRNFSEIFDDLVTDTESTVMVVLRCLSDTANSPLGSNRPSGAESEPVLLFLR